MLFAVISLFSLMPAAGSTFAAKGCWLGEPYAFSESQCAITINNTDRAPLKIKLTAQGATVSPQVLEIPANGSMQASVRVKVGNELGLIDRAIHIRSDQAGAADATVWIRGFVMSALDDPRPQIQLGTIEDLSKPIERTIDLASRDTTQFRIIRVLEHPVGVEISIDSNGHTLHVKLSDDVPFGILDGDIRLAIDTPHQHEAWIHISGDIHGGVTVENNPYWFGNVEASASRAILVPLQSKTGADFRIGDVRVAMVKANAEIVPCEPPAQFCKAIRLTFDDMQPLGLTRAKLDIDLPDEHRHMIVRIWGVLQNSAKPASAPNPLLMAPGSPDFSAPWTEGIVDSVNAPVYALPVNDPLDVADGPTPSTQPPSGSGPLLKWQVTDESGVYGYQIFRAEAEEGPFLLQNTSVLRAHSKQYSSTPYFWRDQHAKSGSTYWYYIGAIYKDGRKQVLSPPRSKAAE